MFLLKYKLWNLVIVVYLSILVKNKIKSAKIFNSVIKGRGLFKRMANLLNLCKNIAQKIGIKSHYLFLIEWANNVEKGLYIKNN